jgi:hypothetical protein
VSAKRRPWVGIWRTGRLRSSCAARYGVHVRPVGWLGTGASQHSSRSIGMGLQNLRGSYDERNPNRGAGWSIWTGSVPGGETIEQVGHRTERVIKQALAAGGDVLPFAHSHILRVLTACWLDLPPDAGRLFALNTASMSVLGYEHEDRVISVWNQDWHLVRQESIQKPCRTQILSRSCRQSTWRCHDRAN